MNSKIQNPKSKIKEKYYLIINPGVFDGNLGFFVVDARGERVIEHEFEKNAKSIEKLFTHLDRKLMSKQLTFGDLRGVAVMRGGESFSAVRGVHAIANALAWSLGVPAVKVESHPVIRPSAPSDGGAKSESHKVKKSVLLGLRRRKRFQLLIPEYSREPNITVSTRLKGERK